MLAPKFWNERNWKSLALLPLGCIYAGITYLRVKLHKPYKASVPVICIGNLTAGGSGKTPVALSIAKILKQNGKTPFFVSRGYGGTLSDVVVNKDIHSPQEVGDEPLLLAQCADVVINHRRDKAAVKAIEYGADTIVMDDGFQNPFLYKDKSLLVIDGAVGMGNEFPIPAGPMREFFSSGIKRADAIILLGEDKFSIAKRANGLPVFNGKVTTKQKNNSKRKVVAFAGIGRPEKFYQSLENCGYEVVKTFSFPDHHFYNIEELTNIVKHAEELGADIYTTSKDMIKIPYKMQSQFKVLEIDIAWDDEKKLTDFLLK